MKKNIVIILSVIVVSLAFINANSYNENDYSVNQLGAYIIYEGVVGESTANQGIGGMVLGIGGSAIVTPLVTAVSNPIGWVVGGTALVL